MPLGPFANDEKLVHEIFLSLLLLFLKLAMQFLTNFIVIVDKFISSTCNFAHKGFGAIDSFISSVVRTLSFTSFGTPTFLHSSVAS